MKERREQYKQFFLAMFFGVLAAYLGLSFGYPRVFTPEKDYGVLSGVARDGWIEDGSQIVLPRLFQRGNRIDLELDSWRPVPEPATLSFSVCGEEVHKETVDKNKTVRVFLTGECLPRVVTVKVENPIQASPTDLRQIGAKLKSLSISSKIGPPIIDLESAFIITPFIVALSLLFAGLVPLLGDFLPVWLSAGQMKIVVALLVSATSGWLVFTTHISPVGRLFTLWVVFATTLAGVYLGRGFQRGSSDNNSPSLETRRDLSGPLHGILLLGVIGVAYYLRFVDLSFGLPMNYHPDEVPKVNAIMRMAHSGSLDPQYFLHPTLLLYCTYGMNSLFHLFGVASGPFADSLVIAGRTVSATAGLLSVFLVYQIGQILFSKRAGILASALLAVFPLHVTCSRYLKEDSLLTLFVLLSFLFAALAYKTKKPGWLLLSGLFAGCSASVKYSGILSAGIPCLGAMCLEEKWIPRKVSTYLYLLGGLLLIPVAFIACSPYVILNSKKFIHDFTVEQRHMAKGHFFAITGWSQYWTYHVERSLLKGITSPPFFLTFVSIGFLAFRRKLNGLMILALIFAFYFPAEYVKAKPAPQPERYIVPCLPFVALAIGGFADTFFRKRHAFLLALLIFLLSPMIRAFQLHGEIVPDTRLQLANWIEENIPPGSRIYVDHKRYSPELSEEKFKITYAPRGAAHKDLDLELLAESGEEYLILSSLWYDRYFSQPRTDEAVRKKIEAVFREGKVKKRFVANYGTYGFHNPTVTLFELSSSS